MSDTKCPACGRPDVGWLVNALEHEQAARHERDCNALHHLDIANRLAHWYAFAAIAAVVLFLVSVSECAISHRDISELHKQCGYLCSKVAQ